MCHRCRQCDHAKKYVCGHWLQSMIFGEKEIIDIGINPNQKKLREYGE